MAKKRKRKPLTKIPPEQLGMPATFGPDGEQVTLRELMAGKKPYLSLSQLTADQRAELTARRVELKKDFELGMVGAGLIDKARAITEIRAQSKIGRTLIEIEQRLIADLLRQLPNI